MQLLAVAGLTSCKAALGASLPSIGQPLGMIQRPVPRDEISKTSL
jgi:hypothetical protein